MAPANLNYISWHWFQSRSGTIFQLYTASFPEVDALSLAKDVTSIVLRHFKSYVVSLYANQSKKISSINWFFNLIIFFFETTYFISSSINLSSFSLNAIVITDDDWEFWQFMAKQLPKFEKDVKQYRFLPAIITI